MIKTIFFKNREPKKFSYKPRFYDPQKEKKIARVARIKEELGISDKTTETPPPSNGYADRIVGSFAPTRKKNNAVNIFTIVRSRRLRFLLRIITLLLVLALAYLLSVGLGTIFATHQNNANSKTPKENIDNVVEENFDKIIIVENE